MGSRNRRPLIAAAAAITLSVLAATGSATVSASASQSLSGGPGTVIPLPKLAIVYTQLNSDQQGSHLQIGDPLGLASHRLTNPSKGVYDGGASRSPDGRFVLFERDTEQGGQIGFVALAHPGTVTFIETGCSALPDCAADIGPTWSPDGRRVLFDRVMGPFDDNEDAASAVLYSVKLDGSDLRRVSAPGVDPTFEEVGARFSPDARTMVFIRDTRIDGVLKFAIFKSRPDGSHAQQMTPWDLNGDRPSVSPARSGPTAGLVAFETYGGANPGRGDVALIPLDCASVDACMASIRYVTHDRPGPKSAFAASWSPDGRFLTFVEEPHAGWADVWTSRWDGALRHQVTHGAISYSPSWGQ